MGDVAKMLSPRSLKEERLYIGTALVGRSRIQANS
jgi:hypothetical protein